VCRFQEWPEEALRSVAVNFYADVELSSEAHPQLLEVGKGGERDLCRCNTRLAAVVGCKKEGVARRRGLQVVDIRLAAV